MKSGKKEGRKRSDANAPLSNEKQQEYIAKITATDSAKNTEENIKAQLKEVQKLHKTGTQFTVEGPNGTTKQQGVLEYWVRQDIKNLGYVVNNDVKVTQGKGKSATKELAITHLLRTNATISGSIREENVREQQSTEKKEYQNVEKSLIAIFNEDKNEDKKKPNSSVFYKKDANYLTELRKEDTEFKKAFETYQDAMRETIEERKEQATDVKEVVETDNEQELTEGKGGALQQDVTGAPPNTSEFTDTATSDAAEEVEVTQQPRTDAQIDEDIDNLEIETVAASETAEKVDEPAAEPDDLGLGEALSNIESIAEGLETEIDKDQPEKDTPQPEDKSLNEEKMEEIAADSPFDAIETDPDNAKQPTVGDTSKRSSGVIDPTQVMDSISTEKPAQATSQINPEPLDLDIDQNLSTTDTAAKEGDKPNIFANTLNAAKGVKSTDTSKDEETQDLRTSKSVTEAAAARATIEGRGSDHEKRETLDTLQQINEREVDGKKAQKTSFMDKLKNALGIGNKNKATEQKDTKEQSVKEDPKGKQDNKEEKDVPHKEDKKQEREPVKLTNDQYTRLSNEKTMANDKGTKSLGQAVKWGVGAALLMVAAIAFPPLAGVAVAAMAGALVMTAWNAIDCAVAYNNANTITQKLNESNKATGPSQEPQKSQSKENTKEQEQDKTKTTEVEKSKDEVTKGTKEINPEDLAKVTDAAKSIKEEGKGELSDKGDSKIDKATDAPQKDGPAPGRG